MERCLFIEKRKGTIWHQQLSPEFRLHQLWHLRIQLIIDKIKPWQNAIWPRPKHLDLQNCTIVVDGESHSTAVSYIHASIILWYNIYTVIYIIDLCSVTTWCRNMKQADSCFSLPRVLGSQSFHELPAMGHRARRRPHSGNPTPSVICHLQVVFNMIIDNVFVLFFDVAWCFWCFVYVVWCFVYVLCFLIFFWQKHPNHQSTWTWFNNVSANHTRLISFNATEPGIAQHALLHVHDGIVWAAMFIDHLPVRVFLDKRKQLPSRLYMTLLLRHVFNDFDIVLTLQNSRILTSACALPCPVPPHLRARPQSRDRPGLSRFAAGPHGHNETYPTHHPHKLPESTDTFNCNKKKHALHR